MDPVSFRRSFLVFGALAGSLIACGSDDQTEFVPPIEEEDPGFGNAPADPICGEQTGSYEAQRTKTNLLFVLDRSGSMHIRLPGGNGRTRWQASRDGLFAVLDRLPSLNARASVMPFPQGDPAINTRASESVDFPANGGHCRISSANVVSCTGPNNTRGPETRCNAANYTANIPVDLDAASIETIKSQVRADDNNFYWATPLAAAVSAAVDAQLASTNPDGINAVVLFTDGRPTSCDPVISNDGQVQSAIDTAARGLQGGVKTYVIGVNDVNSEGDARPEDLARVATAAGTERAYFVDAQDLEANLISVFEQISRAATDCTFDLPGGKAPENLALVNVSLVSPATGTRVLRRNTIDGWDFVDNNTKFKLYGQACTDLINDGTATARVAIGCSTAK